MHTHECEFSRTYASNGYYRIIYWTARERVIIVPEECIERWMTYTNSDIYLRFA